MRGGPARHGAQVTAGGAGGNAVRGNGEEDKCALIIYISFCLSHRTCFLPFSHFQLLLFPCLAPSIPLPLIHSSAFLVCLHLDPAGVSQVSLLPVFSLPACSPNTNPPALLPFHSSSMELTLLPPYSSLPPSTHPLTHSGGSLRRAVSCQDEASGGQHLRDNFTSTHSLAFNLSRVYIGKGCGGAQLLRQAR